MASAVQWLNCSQSLDTSPMGRPLNTSGKIARFCTIDRAELLTVGSTAAAVTAFVVQAVAFAIFAIPFLATTGAGLFALTVVVANSPGVWTSTILGVLILAAVGNANEKIYDYLYKEIEVEKKVQEEEKDVIKALGGAEAFAQLPKFSPDDVNRIHGGSAENPWRDRLVRFKTTDVKAPITVGLDALNRPFVCLLVKNTRTDVVVNSGKPYVKTVFLPAIGKSWECGSNYDKEEYFDFGLPVYAAGVVKDLTKKTNSQEQLVASVE